MNSVTIKRCPPCGFLTLANRDLFCCLPFFRQHKEDNNFCSIFYIILEIGTLASFMSKSKKNDSVLHYKKLIESKVALFYLKNNHVNYIMLRFWKSHSITVFILNQAGLEKIFKISTNYFKPS